MPSLYEQPAIYDLLHFGWTADLEHYLSLARGLTAALAPRASTAALAPRASTAALAPRASTLECAVGSGRVALALARAGHRVHGIDLDPAMLRAFAERVAQEPIEVRERLSWAEGDLRTFTTGRRWPLVIAAFNALAHLHTDADLDAFLSRARAELDPEGTLAFDVWRPDEATLRGRTTDSPRFRDPRTGEPLRSTETTRMENGLLHVEIALHDLDENPPERLSIELRIRPPEELEAALLRNGFTITSRTSLGEMEAWITRPR